MVKFQSWILGGLGLLGLGAIAAKYSAPEGITGIATGASELMLTPFKATAEGIRLTLDSLRDIHEFGKELGMALDKFEDIPAECIPTSLFQECEQGWERKFTNIGRNICCPIEVDRSASDCKENEEWNPHFHGEGRGACVVKAGLSQPTELECGTGLRKNEAGVCVVDDSASYGAVAASDAEICKSLGTHDITAVPREPCARTTDLFGDKARGIYTQEDISYGRIGV